MTKNNLTFAHRLLTWFDQFGRLDLPWQQAKNPYRVWVSEIMLQQTQVQTAIPFFTRFMERFPDVTTLAHAALDDVLHYWTGLGYYNRAKNLHKAAQQILTLHQGHMPADQSQLEALPGIGRSTAGAILSIAYNQKAPILDGNVKRVLTRLHGILGWVGEKKTQDLLWQIAEKHTPQQRVADFTQAIMDFGATYCTRSKPRCLECPFAKNCRAYQQGIVKQLPATKPKKSIPCRQATFLILHYKHTVLLQKREQKGVWHGLFSVPEMPGKPNAKEIKAFCETQFSLQVNTLHRRTPFRHTFSHYHLDIVPVFITLKSRIKNQSTLWYNLKNPPAVGLPAPVKSLLREASTL